MAFKNSRRRAFRNALQFSLALTLIAAPQAAFAQAKPAAPAQTKAAPAPASPMEKIPKVVAVVNGQTITREKLAQESMRRFGPMVPRQFAEQVLDPSSLQGSGHQHHSSRCEQRNRTHVEQVRTEHETVPRSDGERTRHHARAILQ